MFYKCILFKAIDGVCCFFGIIVVFVVKSQPYHKHILQFGQCVVFVQCAKKFELY